MNYDRVPTDLVDAFNEYFAVAQAKKVIENCIPYVSRRDCAIVGQPSHSVAETKRHTR